MSDRETIEVTVNGTEYQRNVPTRQLLCDFLRHDLGLHGTHVGCEHGSCGACTILLNDHTSRACLMFAVQANGALITTIEGLAPKGELHPIQEALWEEHGLQCGFCTPAVVITLYEYLRDHPRQASEEQIREALGGTICRCTGYINIVRAAQRAAEEMSNVSASQQADEARAP